MAKEQGPFYEELGRRITQARRAVGVKQTELARSIGLSRTSIVNIEKGRQPVQAHILVQLATTLGIDVTKLLPLASPPTEENFTPQLRKLDAGKRLWVERILGTPSLEQQKKDDYGSQILSGEKEGNRTTQHRTDKKSSRTG